MKQLVKRGIFGIAALLILAALPAYSSNLTNFNIVAGGGGAIYTATGGSFYIVQLVGATTYNIPTADELLLTYTLGATPTLVITTTANYAFGGANTIAAGTTLYSATTGLSVSGTSTTGTGGTLNITFTDLTPLALNANFFSDLLADGVLKTGTPNAFDLSGGVIGSYSAGANRITSDTIGLTAVTPEPSSIYLFGAGLVFVAFLAKKHRPDLFAQAV